MEQLLTFQDFEKDAGDKAGFLSRAISSHVLGPVYQTAKSADLYDHQLNETIYNYVQMIFTLTGQSIEDFTASNNKIASNFFHRLNTQRNTYLLGNGVSFSDNVKEKMVDGVKTSVDTTKEFLGPKFDYDLKKAGYYALIHGVTFGFWDLNRLYVFPVTEFVPLWDEETGALRAGIRFWKLAPNKPTIAILYEEDGYTKYKSENDVGYDFKETQAKRAYKLVVQHTDAGGDEVIGEENYSSLPIVPLWGSQLKQSTLVGMKQSIDSFDLIRSGFANDLTDCAQIYWILENYGGMSDSELARFRDRLKVNHIAVADTEGGKVTPYTQDIPYQARQVYLDGIRKGIYEDFGGLDVHMVDADSTNDHLEAAYQPLDEEADDFEYQVVEFVQQILALNDIEDTPVFKRNKVSNEKEQVEMVMLEANYLDEETILNKLPNITVDEVQKILASKTKEDMGRYDVVAGNGNTTGTPSEATGSAGGAQDVPTDGEAVDMAEEAKGQALNGAQTQSLILIMDKFSAGGLTEQQATNMISTAIGISKEDARKIVRGE